MDHQCGACSACCTTTWVPELRKPGYQPCAHQHGGCAIYPQRPQSCRDFQCYWLAHPELSERLRPDRCGVVIEELDVPSRAVLVMVNPSTPFRWKVPPASEMIEAFVANNRPVCLTGPPGFPPILRLPLGRNEDEVWAELTAAARRWVRDVEPAATTGVRH